MDATSFAGTFMISNRRRENSTSSSGASGSSMSGSSYGSSGSSYGSTPSSSGSYFPQSNKGSQNGYGDNRKLSNKCNSSMPFKSARYEFRRSFYCGRMECRGLPKKPTS